MLVAPRTKNRHELSSQLSSDVSEVIIENTEIRDNELSEVLENTEIRDNEPSEVLENTENINDESSQLTILNEQRVDRLPQRRRSRYISTRVSIGNIGNIEQDLSLRESTAEDQSEDTNEDNESNGDDESENNNSETFEDYSCPSFKPYQDPDVTPTPTSDDNKFLWILIWIMKFQMRFNISETATESLIKFIKLLLDEIGDTAFENFPVTLYKARNIFNIEDRFYCFAACTKCHKLYNKQEVEEFRQDEILAIMKCQHIEFPNSSRRQKCQTPLSHQIRLLNKVSNRIEMIYPFSTIRQQLATLYLRSGFERSLRH
ncbi:hypothetical protein GLOIN_2v1770724 [Rhizophagus irregularis DAOM 181602=DAOM 197198]|nr:hypothetical protein GLOIN_2v1770724 [Rhizophagus irregularis DAOM 181602=DAOM 197198]